MRRDYLNINRSVWDEEAKKWLAFAKARWNLERPLWGTWDNSEDALRLLPVDMTGLTAVELGV